MTLLNEVAAAAKAVGPLFSLMSALFKPWAAAGRVHLGQSTIDIHDSTGCRPVRHGILEKTPIHNDDPTVRIFEVAIIVEFHEGSGFDGERYAKWKYKSIAPGETKIHDWFDDRLVFDFVHDDRAVITMRIEWSDGKRRWARPYRGNPYRLDGFPAWVMRRWQAIVRLGKRVVVAIKRFAAWARSAPGLAVAWAKSLGGNN